MNYAGATDIVSAGYCLGRTLLHYFTSCIGAKFESWVTQLPLCLHKHLDTCVRDLLLPLILTMRFHFSWMPFGKNGRNITSLRAGQQTYRARVRPSYWEEDLPYKQAGSVRVVQFKAEDDTFQLLAKHISEEYYENAPSDVGQAKLVVRFKNMSRFRCWLQQLTNQPTNQPTNQSTNQPSNQPTNHPTTNQSTNLSVWSENEKRV